MPKKKRGVSLGLLIMMIFIAIILSLLISLVVAEVYTPKQKEISTDTGKIIVDFADSPSPLGTIKVELVERG